MLFNKFEPKRERAESYNEFEEFDKVDVEEFIKKDIYDEYIDFKCLDCSAKHELEADIVFELFDSYQLRSIFFAYLFL